MRVRQCFAVDEDQRGGGSFGDHGARHDRLARPGRGDQDTVVVREHRTHGSRLTIGELGGKDEVNLGPCDPVVDDVQPRPRPLHDLGHGMP